MKKKLESKPVKKGDRVKTRFGKGVIIRHDESKTSDTFLVRMDDSDINLCNLLKISHKSCNGLWFYEQELTLI